MGKTAKLTITLPRELISLADKIAKERKTSRSKVVSACLQDLAERRRATEMAEGYQAMAQELQRFARMTSEIAPEVLPEWQ